jgi:hypothetical protein
VRKAIGFLVLVLAGLIACRDPAGPGSSGEVSLETKCRWVEQFLIAPGNEYGTPFYWQMVNWWNVHCRSGGLVVDHAKE